MTFRTYTKKGVFFHAVYIAILTVSGILAVYSAVFGALHISCKEDKIALGFTVFFALLIISVDFFECRAMGARIYTNAEGIGVRRFGKTKVFIKWSEIKEVGTGNIPTPLEASNGSIFATEYLMRKKNPI